MKTKGFSLSAISKPRFTTNDIHVDDYPQAEVIIQKFSRKLIVNKVGEVEWLSNGSLTEPQHGGFTGSSTVKPVTANGEQEQ